MTRSVASSRSSTGPSTDLRDQHRELERDRERHDHRHDHVDAEVLQRGVAVGGQPAHHHAVITLISGSAPSSFQRSGTPAGWPGQSGGQLAR